MKSTIMKALLIVIFSVCIYDALPAEEIYATQTAPLAITSMQILPRVTGDHHRRRRRRRVIHRRIIHRRIHHRRHY